MSLVSPALDFARRNWFHPAAGPLLAAGLALGLLVVFSQLDLAQVSVAEWTVIVAVPVGALIVWWRTVAPSRHPTGRIGFGIAMRFEDPAHKRQMENDFTDALSRLLSGATGSREFHVIQHPPHVAGRVTTEREARVFSTRTRARFLLYGHAKEREFQGSPRHVLELTALVRHGPVGKKVSARLADEFREVLPNRFLIGKDSDFLALQVTAEWIDVVARYIVGSAAALSGDLDYAESLFEDLEAQLAGDGRQQIPVVSKIRNRLPDRLADIAKVRFGIPFMEYGRTRDPELLTDCEPWLMKVLEYDPNWYGGLLGEAIVAFVLYRDLDRCWAAIKKCGSQRDTTWRYSAAFLHGYEGNLKEAWSEYRKAFANPPEDETVPIQSEEFIHIVLGEEPEQGQLHFCSAMINRKAKLDMQAVAQDLRQFLQWEGAPTFPAEVKLAEKWLEEAEGTDREV